MKKKLNKKRGQVLVMVLITMMVLAIILISIVNNTIRDTQNTRNSIIYETLYSVAEKNTVDVIHSFKNVLGKLDVNQVIENLEALGYDPADIECAPMPSKAECVACQFKDGTTQKYFANNLGEDGQSVIMNICDSTELHSIETINGNHVFFNLIGSDVDANGQPVDDFTFEVSWESLTNSPLPQFAMEAILDIKFKDVSGQTQYTSLRSVYKNSTSKFPDLVQDESPNAEYFRFIGGANAMSFRVDKNQITNALKQTGAGNSYAKYLANKTNPSLEFVGARFKPIFDNGEEDTGIKISVRAVDGFGTTLQNVSQSRFVQTTAFIKQDPSVGEGIQGSQASVETGIPIYQPPGIFDYILRIQEGQL